MEATKMDHGNTVSTNACRFIHLKNNADPNSLICTYYPDYSSTTCCATSSQVAKFLRLHTAKLGFQCLSFYPHDIGSHLLCSGVR